MDPADVVLRAERYVVLRVPPADAAIVWSSLASRASGFTAATREDDGLSLVVDETTAAALGHLLARAEREPQPYRVITFVPQMPWTVVGFLAKVTTLLAAQRIPLGAIAAYARDHVFVAQEHAERAHTVLRAAVTAGTLP